MWGRRQSLCSFMPGQFQSTLPVRKETVSSHIRLELMKFQSALPVRGETSEDMSATMAVEFQSTLPTQGETLKIPHSIYCHNISIHSPHARRDSHGRTHMPGGAISIHSPRGGETLYPSVQASGKQFQSTLPTRRETEHRSIVSA